MNSLVPPEILFLFPKSHSTSTKKNLLEIHKRVVSLPLSKHVSRKDIIKQLITTKITWAQLTKLEREFICQTLDEDETHLLQRCKFENMTELKEKKR